MQKYYIYNNKEFNEFLTIIQSDTQPNILLSYTTIEYPSTEAGYTRCFDSNTNTWSEQIEDNRNKIVYNINDSTITKVISELGPIPLGFTTVKPTDNVSKKFDTTKNEWYLEAGLTQVNYSDIKNKPFIPKRTSDLTNDTEYITSADIPTGLSKFTNDAGFITVDEIPQVSFTETDPIYTADKPILALKSELFSKSYNDLTDKPTNVQELGITITTDDIVSMYSGDGSYSITEEFRIAEENMWTNVMYELDHNRKWIKTVNGIQPDENGDVNISVLSGTSHIDHEDIFEITLKYDMITIGNEVFVKQIDSITNKWKSENNIIYLNTQTPSINDIVYSDINCTIEFGSINSVSLNNENTFTFIQAQYGQIIIDNISFERCREEDTIKAFAWKNDTEFLYTKKYSFDKIYIDKELIEEKTILSFSYVNPKWISDNIQVYYSDDINNYSLMTVSLNNDITQIILCNDSTEYCPYPISINEFTYLYKIQVLVNAKTTANSFDSEQLTTFNLVKQLQDDSSKYELSNLKNKLALLNEKVTVSNIQFATNTETYQGIISDKAVSPANIMYVLNILVEEKVNNALAGVNAALDELNGI